MIKKQWRMALKLKMVTVNHVKHRSTGSYVFPLIQKCGRLPTCTTDEDGELVYCGEYENP